MASFRFPCFITRLLWGHTSNFRFVELILLQKTTVSSFLSPKRKWHIMWYCLASWDLALDSLQLCGKVDCEWDKPLLPAPESVCVCVCWGVCVWADGWTCSLVSRDIPLSVLALCHGNQTGGLWWPTGAKWGGNNAALNPALKNDFILSSIEQFLTPRHAYACMYTGANTDAYTHSCISNWNVLWEFPYG